MSHSAILDWVVRVEDLGGAQNPRSAVREMEVIGNNSSVLLYSARS